ncbi:MAG: flagellar basal-body MS-ring/collar protein FliF [Bacillota bacterium]|nr:flagellar basal-body MS-ring/collar protein FliF [Bacillota bacterium]
MNRGLGWWRGLLPGARTMLGLGVVAAVLGGALMMFLSQPRFVPLYTGLDISDAAGITQKLSEQGVPYRLQDDGRTVLVPDQQVYQARLNLAAQGLPRQGTVGFEILDKPPLGATEADRRLAYLRALQGELARTIAQVEGVEQVRVHVVVPEPQLFAAQERPVTAAVFLKLRPGAELNGEQVGGIVHLVTHSVEGLRPDGVSVVDQLGRVLSARLEEENTPSGAAGRLLDVQHQFQSDLERRLQSLLEQVLGIGNVATRVTAELNFDSRTVERQLFEPGSPDGVVRSIQQLEETFSGPAGSLPPTDGNIPGYQAGGQGGPSSYQRREVTRNLEVGQVREHTVVMPGSVKRLSVAVVVNRELESAQQEAISRLVAAAIGSDPARQDQITVLGIPFAARGVDLGEKPPTPPVSSPIPDWRYLAAGGGGLALLLVLWWRGRRRRRRAAVPEAVSAPAPAPAAEAVAAQVPSEEPEVLADEARLRVEVEKLARKSPDAVAQLIRAWMAEE